MSVVLHLFSLASLFLNHHYRGTRIHLYPLLTGFALYSLAFFFGVFEETAYYYYYLTLLTSMVVSFFFGTTNFYDSFEPSGRKYQVGCIMTEMKSGTQNRVMIYYPTSKDDPKSY